MTTQRLDPMTGRPYYHREPDSTPQTEANKKAAASARAARNREKKSELSSMEFTTERSVIRKLRRGRRSTVRTVGLAERELTNDD